jgi:glycosyltransferase involved in cell wall biosynthesis
MMVSSPRVSVIVPVYNSKETLRHCLDALQNQTVPASSFEVIVVDDGSSDGSEDLNPLFPHFHFFFIDHQGPSAARNYGAQNASGEIILFTDADCVPCVDWIEKMVAPFEQEIIVGVKGTYLNNQHSLLARFVQAEYESKYEHMKKEKYIDFIDTYSAGYRKDEFLKHGGFDTSFSTSSVEDQEFSFRMAKAGHQMVFVPQARVVHLCHSNNLKDYFLKKFKIGYWKVLVHKKHPHKLIRDSHTPQNLKLQIILLAFAGLFLLLGLIHPLALMVSALFGMLFFTTTLPFAYRIWKNDIGLAIISPFLLLIRTIALSLGFGYGILIYILSPGSFRTANHTSNIRNK